MMSAFAVEFYDNAWWLVEHRFGTEVFLPTLAANQRVTWGDGATYFRLLTRTSARTEAEAIALLNPNQTRQ